MKKERSGEGWKKHGGNLNGGTEEGVEDLGVYTNHSRVATADLGSRPSLNFAPPPQFYPFYVFFFVSQSV